MRWSVRLLGGLSVRGDDGREVTRLRTRKVGTLLAYLALRGGPGREPLPRERLCAAIWPDADEATGRHNLSNALTVLRSVLEPPRMPPGAVLEADRHALRLRPGTFSCDAAQFEEKTAEALAVPDRAGRAAHLTAACSLYTGPLLGGYSDESWVSEEAARLSSLFLRAAVTGAEALLESGDAAPALALASRAVAEDPLEVGAVVCAMRAYLALGEPSSAYAAFRRYERRVRTEFGADEGMPVPVQDLAREARRLVGAARTGRGASKAVGHRQPPPGDKPNSPLSAAPAIAYFALRDLPVESAALASVTATRFFGRDAELQRLSETLSAPRTRVVTVTGPGGTGKTRLVLEAAAIRDHYGTDATGEGPQRTLFVPLADIRAGEDLPAALLRALDVKPEPGQRDLRRLAADVLAGAGAGANGLLVLLDNFEQLVDAGGAEELTALLAATPPAVKLLVTSRIPLRVVGEREFRLSPLATTGGATGVAELAALPAVALFVDRAQMARYDFALTESNAADVAALVDRLEGVPLALELAAARAGVLSPAQMRDQFEARPLDGLRATRRDVAPRHASLRATLEWSAALLPPEARDFLAHMGVFRGGWTLEAAQAVSPEHDTLEMLTLLRDASLVSVADDGQGLRFSLLETVRQFAAEELDRSGRGTGVRISHARYFYEWSQRQSEQNLSNVLPSEYANLLAGLSGALDAGEEDLAVYLCLNLRLFWALSGRLREGSEWMEQVQRRIAWMAPGGQPPEAFGAGVGAGGTATESGEDADGPQYRRWICSLTMRRWFLNNEGYEDKVAQTHFEEFEYWHRIGSPMRGKMALCNAGVGLMRFDLRRALATFEQCLPLERQASADGQGNPVIFSLLARVARLLGRPEETTYLGQALALGGEYRDSDPLGFARASLVAGQAAAANGEYALARELLHAARHEGQVLSHRGLTALALFSLIDLARLTGDPEQEEQLLAEVSATVGSETEIRLACKLQSQKADFLLTRRDVAGAVKLVRQTLTLFQGRAHCNRLLLHPVLLLCAEVELARRPSRAPDVPRAARALGAAGGVSDRLGLVVSDPIEQERTARLVTNLSGLLGARRLAEEQATGAALGDEAALDYALELCR